MKTWTISKNKIQLQIHTDMLFYKSVKETSCRFFMFWNDFLINVENNIFNEKETYKTYVYVVR